MLLPYATHRNCQTMRHSSVSVRLWGMCCGAVRFGSGSCFGPGPGSVLVRSGLGPGSKVFFGPYGTPKPSTIRGMVWGMVWVLVWARYNPTTLHVPCQGIRGWGSEPLQIALVVGDVRTVTDSKSKITYQVIVNTLPIKLPNQSWYPPPPRVSGDSLPQSP